ncbi:MAG: intradiol ring-cleavage dioxygenase [Dehalococcoidia bacterium]
MNEMSHDHDDHNDIHDQGLQFDVRTLMHRRNALRIFSGAALGGAALAIVGCGDDTPAANSGGASNTPSAAGATSVPTGSTTAATSQATAGTSATALVTPIATGTTPASACTTALPEETAGPYPGDGSNGPNVLTQSGIVRSDIRSSFGTSTNTAKGVPMTIDLTIVDTAKNCAPIAGAALYLWHCDMTGGYSMYSNGVQNENYLRGVQVADANGKVKFTSIFPGCYSGRWPHVHFEVYPSLAKATSSANKLATSQLALPEDVCKVVYATDGYSASVRNLAQTSLNTDNVFRDGWTTQLATVSGSVANGYTASLIVGV